MPLVRVSLRHGKPATHLAALRREDVFINLLETGGENWSFGNGVAQLA